MNKDITYICKNQMTCKTTAGNLINVPIGSCINKRRNIKGGFLVNVMIGNVTYYDVVIKNNQINNLVIRTLL